MVSCSEDHFENDSKLAFRLRLHTRLLIRDDRFAVISLVVQLMKYGFVFLLFDDYMMSQTSCNPKTMSIKPLRVTSSFMV